MRRVSLIAALLLALPLLGQAQSFTYGPNGGRASVPLTAQALADGRIVYTPLGNAGNVNAAVSMSATVEGRAVAMTAARSIGWQVLGNAIARGLPTVAVGSAVYSILQSVRCESNGGTVSGGGYTCDPGQAQQSGQTLTHWRAREWLENSGSINTVQYGSAAAACAASWADWQAKRAALNPPRETELLGSINPTSDNCGVGWRERTAGGSWDTYTAPNANLSIQFYSVTTTGTGCPAVIDFSNPANNIPAGSPPGADGLCPTPRNQHVVLGPTQVGARIFQYGDPSRAAEAAGEVTAAGRDMSADAGPVNLTGPATSVAPPRVTTTTNPDGSTTTTSQQRQANITYNGDSYTYNISNTSVTTAPGGTTTTTTEGQPEIEVCGLPGTPPCKIDETGTPTGAGVVDAAVATVQQTQADAVALVGSASGTEGKSTAWSFSFALPTGCSPLTLAGFSTWVGAIDMCAYQPTIHDLLSMVWLVATAWALIALFTRAKA